MFELIHIVKRRRLLVAVILAITLGAAIGATFVSDEVYEVRSELLLRAPALDPLEQDLTVPATRSLNNEILQIESAVARAAVRKVYQGPLDPDLVKATAARNDADVIVLTARAGNPTEAATLVNTYVEAYVSYRRDLEVEQLLAAGVLAEQKVAELQRTIAAASAPLAELDRRLITATADELVRLRDQRQNLATEIEAQLRPLRDQLSFYQDQSDRAELTAGIRRSGSLVLLRAAEPSDSPVSPSLLRNLLWGLAAGLVLATAAALARDRLDDAVNDRDVLESITNVPTVAMVPKHRTSRGARASTLPVVHDQRSATAESFRILRTSLRFLRTGRPMQAIAITSPLASEGKTHVAQNLAATLAQVGDRVVLVGCDLRRPGIDKMDGLGSGAGFTSVLLGDASLDDALWEHPDVKGLSVLRTGDLPPNPAELLSAPATAEVIAELRRQFDWVILDCSPLLPVADARVVARFVDGVLLVARDGATSRQALQRSVEALTQAQAPLVGAVLNSVAETTATYGDAYAAAPASTTPRPRPDTAPAGTAAPAEDVDPIVAEPDESPDDEETTSTDELVDASTTNGSDRSERRSVGKRPSQH